MSDTDKRHHCHLEMYKHQNALMWSRTQFAYLVTTATLGGLYVLRDHKADTVTPTLLLILFLLCISLFWCLATRDRKLRKAHEDHIGDCLEDPKSVVKGRHVLPALLAVASASPIILYIHMYRPFESMLSIAWSYHILSIILGVIVGFLAGFIIGSRLLRQC